MCDVSHVITPIQPLLRLLDLGFLMPPVSPLTLVFWLPPLSCHRSGRFTSSRYTLAVIASLAISLAIASLEAPVIK